MTTVGLIGCGKMGGALARAFVAAGRLAPEALLVCDVVSAAAADLAADTGGRALEGPQAVVDSADIVLLAVKPQQFGELLEGLRLQPGRPRIVVSIAAGFPMARLRRALGVGPAIVRTMPNRPALVAAGVTALMGDEQTPTAAVDEVEDLFRAAGATVRIDDEGLFDAVTALSGSGPAFVFRLIEALEAGGTAEGLDPAVARTLAVATTHGAAELLRRRETSPAEERVAVSSPGGTTLAGLGAMRQRGFYETVIAAVRAAAARSRELAKGER